MMKQTESVYEHGKPFLIKYQVGSKRREMMSYLEERERSGFASTHAARPYDEDKRIARRLKEKKVSLASSERFYMESWTLRAPRILCENARERSKEKANCSSSVVTHGLWMIKLLQIDKPLDCAVLSRLKNFSAMNKLKKRALRVNGSLIP
ncbi:uncharacterized protein LOC108825249 [Raphanus sativus]|uniref:Uncharacterized protein LOC108825249 n=1 Tax=Raphanus sativus TaxID=3726 RepID=A0A6J0L2G9_RAPSA|nr:uncharacterized protein LOC108825249 [Raphanus sativus]